MLELSSASIVAIYSVPTTLWLFFRFGEIIFRQHKVLKHHIGQAISSNARHNGTGLVAFAVHVLTGLPVLVAAPYLAYLLVPGQGLLLVDEIKTTTPAWLFLTVLALALVAVNASAFLWILPNPSRYKAYTVDKRSFVRGLGILYIASLEFTAMAMSALGLLTENHALKTFISLVVPAIYLWVILICACECAAPKFEWENQFWASPILGMLGYGLKSKSKVTAAFTNANDTRMKAAHYSMYSIFGIAALLAFVQSVAMLESCIYPPKIPISKAQELYFVLLFLYVTIVMSSGFFTMVQSIFDSEKQPNRGNAKVLVEIILSQAVPMLLLQVGPEWIGVSSFSEFFARFIMWKPK